MLAGNQVLYPFKGTAADTATLTSTVRSNFVKPDKSLLPKDVPKTIEGLDVSFPQSSAHRFEI